MKNLILLLGFVIIFPYYASSQEIIPRQIDALNELYNSAGGKNWHYKTINDLLKRKESPYFKKYKNLVGYNGTGYFRIEIMDFSNNNLVGEIPDAFAYKKNNVSLKWSFTLENLGIAKFSYNEITKVSDFIGFSATKGYYKELWLDNNKISEINIKPVKGTSVNPYASSSKFCIHQNDLSSLSISNLGSASVEKAIVGYHTVLCRIDNNRLNFDDIIKIKKSVEATKAIAIGGHLGPEWEYIYAPQKAVGGKSTETTLDNGDSKDLSFKLVNKKNKYTWLLNGKPINAQGTNYSIRNFDASQAGVYTCKVTNEELSDLTICSYDMAVWLKKPGNKAPTDITISNNKANSKMPLYTNIAQFTGMDPDKDKLYFRLDDKKANNSSFRIINGSTLIVADKLFSEPFIKNYTIVVEAYDCFGGKFEKEFTIEKYEIDTDISYPTAINLSKNTINENEIGAIGDFSLEGVSGGKYSFSLTDELDNNLFLLKGNKLSVKNKLNFERRKSYTIRLNCLSSDKKITLTKDFDISVIDCNDKPEDVILCGNTVILGAPLYTNVGVLQTIDEDVKDLTFGYSFDNEGESNNKEFKIIQNRLVVAKNFKPADVQSKKIKIKTTDEKGAEFSKSFTVKVLAQKPENRIPLGLGITNAVITSDMEVNSIFGKIFLSDPEGELGTFSCNNEYVEIIGNLLLLKSKPEKGINFKLTIEANDGDNKITQDFTIYTAKDVNGIDEINLDKNINLKIYPNPTSTTLTVDGIDGEFIIYNIQGQELLRTNENTIDVSQLYQGTYILKVVYNNKSLTKTFIKQ
ncbi:MAG: T9SS type A sorting domain-containing protein [Bacteroidales bacterium]|nr:T9SS type A sorting domain-containing protein [Bacteroidales bacterium]